MFPSGMKTGFSLIESFKPEENICETLNNLLLIFSEKSIILGAHYAKCSGRDNLSGMDTVYALQYLAHEFMNMEDLESLLSQKSSVGMDSESEEDTDTESCSDCDEDDVFIRASNDDSLCRKMNEYHDTWSEWNPTDEIEVLLKRNIDKTMLTM